ncbi:MAG: hypothetical protein U9N87_06760 [Planctomycetota bacterium]|nr:hypothetical protein [Planctomycetota bacterium]
MALQVQCPQCGGVYQVDDEQAGGTATCPECRTLARIPAVDFPQADSRPALAGPPQSPYPAPQHAAGVRPPRQGQDPYYAPSDPGARRQAAEERAGFHLRLIGVLSLVMSVLCLIWGLLCIFVSLALRSDAFPIPPEFQELQDPAVMQFAVVFYLVVGLLSLVTFCCLLASGICVLARRRWARLLGLIVAALSCASLWQCFLYPFCLGLGIYSIVVLYSEDARLLLERPAEPGGGFPPL